MEYILGVIVSLVAQGAKKYLKSDPLTTQLIVVVLAMLAAGFYVWFKDTGIWETILSVLVTAGATHNFILRKFE